MSTIRKHRRPMSARRLWNITLLTLGATLLGLFLLYLILDSAVSRQLDPKGCRMSYMRPSYVKLHEFDSEHTRFATKYSLYLYREQGIDVQTKLRGVPILFIPGNAGSYKQVRPIAAEAANFFHESLQRGDLAAMASLDFFTVDFNEDITAFHGQTLVDQAEYLNEAIRYILSLYMDPHMAARDHGLPDPTSVIVLGHSMGGIVARTMVVMPNYQPNSINTIITMSAPHARPPVSFDNQIVKIYKEINDYWSRAYAQKWANDNPLWHITLVSIAGGGLDTVVPSDYSSLESLVPDTHGFTVFTTSIPSVWVSMDHQAIMWCDQFRKVVAKALYGVIDVTRAPQTKPRAERMRVFRKAFLTGLEPDAEKSAPSGQPTTLLTLSDESYRVVGPNERLDLNSLGSTDRRVFLFAVPPRQSTGGMVFSLLSDAEIKQSVPGSSGKLEVLVCNKFSSPSGHSTSNFVDELDFSVHGKVATRLACKNAAPDSTLLPRSTSTTSHPFFRDRERPLSPFSYLQYNAETLAEPGFIVIIDAASSTSPEFVRAGFQASQRRTISTAPWQMLASSVGWTISQPRPLLSEVHIPALKSSLFSYSLDIDRTKCSRESEAFTPMVRQFLSGPFESKYFVNASHADISFHGVAPFVPSRAEEPPLEVTGLSFQFWLDPTCDAEVSVTLSLDIRGSLGRLYMRYRTALAAFPIFVVSLVLCSQLRHFDGTGEFLSFSEGLDSCLRSTIPLFLVALTMLGFLVGSEFTSSLATTLSRDYNLGASGFQLADVLTGSQDSSHWFLLPLIGIISVALCALLHYATLVLTQVLCIGQRILWMPLRHALSLAREGQPATSSAFVPSSPQRRLVTTAVLLLLVSTFVPYQFAYLVACIVQVLTSSRAMRSHLKTPSTASLNFYNYTHSILLLMLWVLPINLPILAVWVRNLAVHWLTPFSSHHNVLSIMPFILLVENMTSGRMVPRVTSHLRIVSSAILTGTSVFAAVYGISHAYMLHYLVNLAAGWMVFLYVAESLVWFDSWPSVSLRGFDPTTRKE